MPEVTVEAYLRRAWAELTGKKLKKSEAKIHTPHIPVALMLGGGLLLSSLIIGLVWMALPLDNKTATNCAFRIPEAGASQPDTPGDATARLDACVKLEAVSTPSAVTLGLSNRPSMPRDRGMLFDFSRPDRYCMWMKDMHFALDIIWLNEAKEIVLIRSGISPDTYPASFCGPAEARYVIELNAGTAKAGDLRKGQSLNF